MCGILGIVSRTPGSVRRLAAEDIGRLRHRGPDGHGFYNDESASLGHARLSILDLSERACQPMASADGRYICVFNGEIYNFLELRQRLAGLGHTLATTSDTEVLVAAYAQWGRECLPFFRGMFAFAIWDRLERRLFAARDRCGEKPFFYWRDARSFLFASELKGLVPLLEHKPALNAEAVNLYLHYQYVPEPWTLLEGVHKLPAGHYLELDCDSWELRQERYWRVDDFDAVPGDAPRLIAEKLEEAVRLCLRSDVPVGVALSGGIDSGAIAALASRNYGQPMHAFSVGYPGRPRYDERAQAEELARKLGLIFHEVEIPVDDFVEFFPRLVKILDEPVADPAAFGHYAVPKAAAELGIKVLLTGIGGDELFWGYDWTRRAVAKNEEYFSLSAVTRWLGGRLARRSMSRVRQFLPLVLRHAAELAGERGNTPPDQPLFLGNIPDFQQAFALKRRFCGEALLAQADSVPFLPTARASAASPARPEAVLTMLFETWLVSNCLTLGDRVSMACGVESRLPFLDAGLIALVQGLRKSVPDHAFGQKALLKKALAGVLPAEVLQRPKRGFQPPVQQWLSGVIEAYGGVLRQGELARDGIYANGPISVQGLDWPALFFVYKLLLLEMWRREIC